MSRFEGAMTVNGDTALQVNVTIDLTSERIVLLTGDTIIGSWPIAAIGMRGEDDGIHFKIEGDHVLIHTDDDAGLALALGLSSASPRLRRQMATRRKRLSNGGL